MYKLTLKEGEFLVKLARRSITEYLKDKNKITPPEDTPEKMKHKSGVFTTLTSIKTGDPTLRGCIGYPQPVMPLVEAVIDSAINAATGDPRFPSVTQEELDQIIIEVSVLTPPQLLKLKNQKDAPDHIEIGKDGLIIEHGHFRGLLLPQVPIEWKWDAEEFLTHCSLKAGLQPDAWLLEGTKIYKFSCEIFKENKPKGPAIKVQL
jgi:uncharacterized protein (TIGR00296 family)